MFSELPIFWQASSFTLAAVPLVGGSAWWLYFSPLKHSLAPAPAPSARLAAWLAALLGLATVQMVVGALWDASQHIITGEVPAGADFLWPPHLLLYSGFLLTFVVALLAIGLVAARGWQAGRRDPRLWVRGNPYVGAVALASVYALGAIPGDALWHELYGLDLTAWSPPHLLLGAMLSTVVICAVGLLARARPALARPRWADVGTVVLLGLMLNVAMIIGTIEWEEPIERAVLPSTLPIWVYPLIAGALAFFTMLLARRLTALRWAATGTTLVFLALRLVVSAGLRLSDNIAPAIPPLFIAGAFLIDLIPWERVASPRARSAGLAAAFTLGYCAVALPLLAARGNLQPFSSVDMVAAVVAVLAVSLGLLPAIRFVSARLAGEVVRA